MVGDLCSSLLVLGVSSMVGDLCPALLVTRGLCSERALDYTAQIGKSEPIKVGKASPTEGTLPGSVYFILKQVCCRGPPNLHYLLRSSI